MSVSGGEKLYRSSFVCKKELSANDSSYVQDFLYKYSFNYGEAREYLQLLIEAERLHGEQPESRLIYRIYGMSLQCFSLAVRKLIDKNGKRSAQKIRKGLFDKDFIDTELTGIKEVYSHYEDFLTKFVVHQDDWSFREGIRSFPDLEVVTKDMEILWGFYYLIAHRLCNSFPSLRKDNMPFSDELNKLS